jgi:hypothetical protein
MWKAWKGVSFAAIKGLYEMSIQMQRTKMREMRNCDLEMYGPRKKLESQQLANKMKASKAARKTHQIMKRTNLICDTLNWRISDLIARDVETQLNEWTPVAVATHDKISEKKKATLIKQMHSLKSLIAPFDPEATETYDEESTNEEGGDGPVQPTGAKFIPKSERIPKICDSMLQGPRKEVTLKTEEEETSRRVRDEEPQRGIEVANLFELRDVKK